MGNGMMANLIAQLDLLPLDSLEAAGRLVLACVLGGMIGAERDRHGRSAGLRTQLLVCLGSCLAMLVSVQFAEVFAGSNVPDTVQVDPARVAYGVMGGIGFLGAGVIIQDRAGVKGITTAASLWCTAAIGLATGLGMYAMSLFAAGLTIFALLVLHRLGEKISAHTLRAVQLVLRIGEGTENIRKYDALLEQEGMSPSYTRYVRNHEQGTETVLYRVRARDTDLLDIAATCGQDENVLRVTVS